MIEPFPKWFTLQLAASLLLLSGEDGLAFLGSVTAATEKGDRNGGGNGNGSEQTADAQAAQLIAAAGGSPADLDLHMAAAAAVTAENDLSSKVLGSQVRIVGFLCLRAYLPSSPSHSPPVTLSCSARPSACKP
jgi:hypothetical protein